MKILSYVLLVILFLTTPVLAHTSDTQHYHAQWSDLMFWLSGIAGVTVLLLRGMRRYKRQQKDRLS